MLGRGRMVTDTSPSYITITLSLFLFYFLSKKSEYVILRTTSPDPGPLKHVIEHRNPREALSYYCHRL